jgi:hypothetical protein
VNRVLLSEELLLLLTEHHAGRDDVHQDVLATAVAGALVCELAVLAVIEVSDGSRGAPPGCTKIIGALWEPDDLLIRAIRIIESGRHPSMRDLVAELRHRAVPPVFTRLERQGLIRRNRRRSFTLISSQRWRAIGSFEAQLIGTLGRIDAGEAASTPRTDALARLYSTTRSLSAPGPEWPAEDPTRDEPWTVRLRQLPPVWAATEAACREIRVAHTMRDRDQAIRD